MHIVCVDKRARTEEGTMARIKRTEGNSHQNSNSPRGHAHLSALFVCVVAMSVTPPVRAAINVSLSVNSSNTRAVMPDSGIGLHTSVYANQFANPSLPSRISESGVDLLRYPGGSYSDIYHWSNNTSPSGGYVA